MSIYFDTDDSLFSRSWSIINDTTDKKSNVYVVALQHIQNRMMVYLAYLEKRIKTGKLEKSQKRKAVLFIKEIKSIINYIEEYFKSNDNLYKIMI